MFNPDARWDRKIPSTEGQSIDEVIEVDVIFKAGKAYPRYFLWRQERFLIKEITYYWQEIKGQDKIFYFSGHDKVNLYKLSFNASYLTWRLCAVSPL